MSYLVTPFEVSSKTLGEPVKIRFVHLLSGIATRHRDSIDCTFLVNGRKVLVAISCATLTALREQKKVFLTDQQLVEVAAQYLRRNLEDGYDPSLTELFLEGDNFFHAARELKFLQS
ncbi:MAG TPA: hypothetical protein VKV95_14035 [Terriglobia bacterium]|nr:hypothetical protein [Terriglobia bacterium]